MILQPWELRVWTPLGDGPRIIPRDESYIRATGLRMQLTPEGDCREAAFTARGNGLGVRTLDCVQIVYGGTPLFYGEVRDGGNVRDVDGHGYVLNSAVLALKEVTLSPGFVTPQQPAHLTVRAILQDVINSGQLGSPPVIEFDPALCPDLGFDCRAVKDAFQQNAHALLERIAQDGAGYGVTVRFGVRPDRRFFCQAAQVTVRALNPEEMISVNWREPVAEAPVTAVLWYIAKRSDGTWLTYLSESPEVALYRRRVKSVAVENTDGLWAPVLGGAYTEDPESEAYYWGKDSTVLTDNLTDDRATVTRKVDAPAVLPLTFTVTTGQQVDRVVISGQAVNQNVKPAPDGSGRVEVFREVLSATVTLGDQVQTRPLDWTPQTYYGIGTATAVTISVPTNRPEGWYTQLDLTEFRPEQLRRDLLDRLARYHYKTPAPEPADIELLTFIPPAELPKYITLTGHPNVAGTYQSIVDAWEYRLSAERGMTLGCLAGQAEDPAVLAQADLIKARDGQSVIIAITAGGTG